MLFESLSKDFIKRVLLKVENVMYITSPYDLDKSGLVKEFANQKRQVGISKKLVEYRGGFPVTRSWEDEYKTKPDDILGMGQPSPRILSTGMTKDNSMEKYYSAEDMPQPNVYVEEGEIDILIFSKLSYNPIRLLDVINQIANVLVYPNLEPAIDPVTKKLTPWKPGVLIFTYGSCEDDVFSQSERKQYRMSTCLLYTSPSPRDS